MKFTLNPKNNNQSSAYDFCHLSYAFIVSSFDGYQKQGGAK
jgi:hypothetical protein